MGEVHLLTARRRGLTLIELLVVIGIVGILASLLLPAVQAAREAARRATCSNNLRQLGLAAHQHHDTHQHFPPGIGYYPLSNQGVFGTYFFHLLPFLEQSNLYDLAEGSVNFFPRVGPIVVHYPGNHDVYRQSVPTFLCPSDPSVGSGGVVTIDNVPFGASCYAPNALVSASTDFQAQPPRVNPQGRARMPADFPDGMTHTILHAEKYATCRNTDMAPLFQDGGTAWAFCNSVLFPWQPPPMNPPGKAFQPGFAIAALAFRGAPNAIGPGSKFQLRPNHEANCDPTRAATAHTAIVVGLADGSVRTVSATIRGDVWWSAVTPAGREVLDW